MQVGISQLDAPPLAVTTTGDATYRYRLLPDDVVLVDKRMGDGSWDESYRYVLGACNCPGYQHRADCKHSDIARGLIQWWRESQA